MRLIFLAAAWIAGTLVGLETNAYLPSLISFAIAAVVLALIFRIRGFSLWIPILALVMVMGIIRVETSEDTLSFQTTDRLHSISIRGVVADDPELAASGVEFVLGVDAIDTGEVWEDGEGSVLVIARPPRELVQKREAPYFRYGDRLELTGSLDEPPILGEFDYRTYLANQGIHFTMAFPDDIRLVDTGKGNPALGKIYDLRGKLAQGIDGALALIHRRTACRRPAEETKECASESGIMVLKQKTGPRKGAPDRCYHVTTPTGSKSPSTTTAWWPMPG